MLRNITIAIITAAAALLPAAVSGAEPWNLDSCISYAVSHNLEISGRLLSAADARQGVTEAKDRFLPQISGSADQSFSFGRGLTSDNTYANRNTQNFSVGLGFQLPLFQGLSAVRRLDYAKANLSAALLQLEAEKDNVELNVTTQYLQVLYAGEVAEVAREQLRMSEYELSRRRRMLEAGKIPEIDLAEAEAQVATDGASLVTADNDRRLALFDLARMLRLPAEEPFEIDTVIAPVGQLPAAADDIFANALRSNSALRASRATIAAAGRSESLARTGWIPTLSFRAGLSTNYYYLGDSHNPSFSSQMRDNFSKYLGFSLNIPIFDGFSTRNSVRRARLQRLQAELAYEQEVDRTRRAIEQASLQADNAARKLQAYETAERSAQTAYTAMQEKYNYGKASSADLETSRSTFIRARLQRVQARYEWLLRSRILAFYNR